MSSDDARGRMIFVLMPFDPAFDKTWEAILKACAVIGCRAERADKPITTEYILERIYESIANCDLVLADLTDKNPNVFYEVGYAHALGKPVAFLAPTISEVPFDLHGYPILPYAARSATGDLSDLLVVHLRSALDTARDTSGLRLPLERSLRHVVHLPSGSTLFRALAASRLEKFEDRTEQWLTGTIKVGPAEVLESGTVVLRNLARGGFATFLVPVGSYFWAEGDYLNEGRAASKVRGKDITRVYLVANESILMNPNLSQCITLDEKAGIRTFIAYISKINDAEAVRDFAIWDDELLAEVTVSNAGDSASVIGCNFTVHDEEIESARRWRINIMSAAEPASSVLARYKQEDKLHQRLVSSAGVMELLANEHCQGSYLDKENCGWYHASWQYLRILDMVSTPDWHSDFYRDRIQQAKSHMSPRRVLICGTADYGILAHLIAAISPTELERYEIVVLDLCDTPLKICDWFADQIHVNIQTISGNAFELAFRDDWFGLVLTDAFLTRFPWKEKRKVVSEWHRVLAPGGSVITTARVEEGRHRQRLAPDRASIENFVSRAREEATKRALFMPRTPEQVEKMARTYAEHIVSFPTSRGEVRSLFERVAMDFQLEVVNTHGEFRPTDYAQIVATKRKPAGSKRPLPMPFQP